MRIVERARLTTRLTVPRRRRRRAGAGPRFVRGPGPASAAGSSSLREATSPVGRRRRRIRRRTSGRLIREAAELRGLGGQRGRIRVDRGDGSRPGPDGSAPGRRRTAARGPGAASRSRAGQLRGSSGELLDVAEGRAHPVDLGPVASACSRLHPGAEHRERRLLPGRRAARRRRGRPGADDPHRRDGRANASG